jgi:hypothetical protein
LISIPDLKFPANRLLARYRLDEQNDQLTVYLSAGILDEAKAGSHFRNDRRFRSLGGESSPPFANAKGISLESIYWDRCLLNGSAYKNGQGYILGLPVAAYLTWQGRMLENNGIVPKFSIELSRDALKEGRDTQLVTAIDVAKAL